MTHRSDRIWLPAAVARCEPQHDCKQRSTCARYLASIPASGARMIGAGLPTLWGCVDFYPLSLAKPSTIAAPRPIKPAPKGIA